MKHHLKLKAKVHSCVFGMVHKCSQFWTFAKRAGILLGVFAAMTLITVATGHEPLSGFSVVREASTALAEAAADAFGESK